MTVEEEERWLIGFYSVRESFPWNSSFLSAIYLVRPSILAVCYASQSSLMNLTLLIVRSAISFLFFSLSLLFSSFLFFRFDRKLAPPPSATWKNVSFSFLSNWLVSNTWYFLNLWGLYIKRYV